MPSTSPVVPPTSPAVPSTLPGVAPSAPGVPPNSPGVLPNATALPPTRPALDLASLEQRLKDTRAIGVFTKLSLKNQVDDLLGQFRAFHRTALGTPPQSLREQYDLLILKVLSLLQDGDPQLAAAVSSSREAIWGILKDPAKFAKI